MTTNRKRWLRCLAVLLAATLITFFSTSGMPALAADEPLRFKNVVLSVYPEYDDPLGLGYPTILVMLDGQIEGANPPVTVRFLVPKDAVMYSAGSGPRERYVGGPPNRKASDIDGWDEISYALQTNSFVVEYYVAIPASPNKDFSVEFIPLFDIDGLVALVQEPRQAADFNVVPQNQPVVGQQPFTDAEGFNIQRYSFDTLKSRQSVSFHISYTKSNPTPSLAISPSSSNVVLLVILVAVVGGLLLVIILYRVLRKSSSHRRSRDKVSSKLPTRKSIGARFCTQCGTRLDKSERFCPRCGAKQPEQIK